MPVILPITDFASYSEEITLDGTPYRFRLDWNVRREFWSMSVLTADLVPLVSGIKLVLGYQLFDQYPGSGLPPGELYAVDMTDEQVKITRDNLLEEVKLVYIAEAEVDSI
jgi:hypothetical protein